jgi:parallel beta-helix repeat protein
MPRNLPGAGNNIPCYALKGVLAGAAESAVIMAPTTGLVQVDGYAAYLLIQDTAGPVTISNLAVDGLGTTCTSNWTGIVYDAATTGTVTRSVVRNIGTSACVGTAIVAGSSANLKITASSIHDGIYGVTSSGAASLTISSNTFSNLAFGIGVGQVGGQLTITNNVLAPIIGSPFFSNGVGIRVASNQVVSTVSGNTIYGNDIVGIQISQTAYAKVVGNRVSGSYEAIDLEAAAGAVVQNNTITEVVAGLTVNDNGSGGGNVVTGNTVNEAACGIWAPTTPANTWLNVSNINCFSTGIP